MATIQNPFEVEKRDLTINEKARMFNEMLKDKPLGTPFYLKVVEDAGSVMQMGTYANPDLGMHSEYFKSLDSMMKCVEKNAHVTDPQAQNRVCAKEFKNLRIAALTDKLSYHEVNRRWFMRELEHQKNFSGF